MPRSEGSAALVPPEFAAALATRPGGGTWLSALPDLLGELLADWELRIDSGPSRHGHLGVVIPVRSSAGPLALKLSPPSDEVVNQVVALRAWNGRGMVRLVAADPVRGALLLERLDGGRSLGDLETSTAVEIAATVLTRLTTPVSAHPTGLPHLAEQVADWPRRWRREWEVLGRPLPRRVLDLAADECRDLGPTARKLLVDHDLHFRNILAADREPWLAADPRGVLGDPEFAVGPLLWNRFEDDPEDRLHRIVDLAGLDADRARGWAVVRAVDYFLWSTKAGLTVDPAACRRIVDRLADQ